MGATEGAWAGVDRSALEKERSLWAMWGWDWRGEIACIVSQDCYNKVPLMDQAEEAMAPDSST